VALLLLALAILVVRYASSRFPSAPSGKGEQALLQDDER